MKVYARKIAQAQRLKSQFRLAGVVELLAPRRFPFPWPDEWLS